MRIKEAVALAHDLGHTPFGHAGEDALNEVMAPAGGFDHNEQTVRIVTKLEERYAAFDGLNLSWEALEGVIKHNGPVTGRLAQQLPKSMSWQDLTSHLMPQRKHKLPICQMTSPIYHMILMMGCVQVSWS